MLCLLQRILEIEHRILCFSSGKLIQVFRYIIITYPDLHVLVYVISKFFMFVVEIKLNEENFNAFCFPLFEDVTKINGIIPGHVDLDRG